MTNTLLFDLQRNGSAARIGDLAALGHSAGELRSAINFGSVSRVCNGWVATPEADRDAIIAIINGGKLTSSSALSSRGIWDGCDTRIHVAVPPNSPRTTRKLRTPIAQFRPPKYPRSGLVRHWVGTHVPDEDEPAWRASTTDALVVASKHMTGDQFIACVDSAVHTGVLARAGLPRLESLLSGKVRPLLGEVDGRSESGLESLARVRLARIVRDVRVQVPIPGISANGGGGRVDILLNGWLVIELDGDEWHEPRRERNRDAVLVRSGYRSQRFGFDQVVADWPTTEATVRELLRYPPPGRL